MNLIWVVWPGSRRLFVWVSSRRLHQVPSLATCYPKQSIDSTEYVIFTQWRQILFNLPFELFSISFKKNSKGKLKRIWRHWWSIFKNFLKLPSFSQMVSSWNKAREKQSQPIRVVIEVNTLSLSGLFTDPAEGVGLGPDQPQLCKHYSWIKLLDWPIDSYSRGDIDNYITQKTT